MQHGLSVADSRLLLRSEADATDEVKGWMFIVSSLRRICAQN